MIHAFDFTNQYKKPAIALTIPNGGVDICVLIAEPTVNDDYGGVAGVEVGIADGVSVIDF